MSVQSIGGQGTPFPSIPLNNELGKSNPNSTSSASSSESSQSLAQSEAQQKPTPQKLQEAIKSMNDFVDGINSSLKFTVDDKSGQTVVKVVDNDTKEVIKQIPSEEVLAMAQAVDKLKGLLVQQKA
ncbi:MAG: flagellar protein [Rhodocyclales bacterium GT-UBC]|nr:MAG: flagellar protein [Rhodocyclales bacterium GT-UBC]